MGLEDDEKTPLSFSIVLGARSLTSDGFQLLVASKEDLVAEPQTRPVQPANTQIVPMVAKDEPAIRPQPGERAVCYVAEPNTFSGTTSFNSPASMAHCAARTKRAKDKGPSSESHRSN